ncbi:anti-sigma factor [Glycomyces sp. NPDC049804]|uniref:anti-sigma factor n=1 Tax=Glycomyces sp. NPDC049804 TaxID=3154363 RepID=UPI003431C105
MSDDVHTLIGAWVLDAVDDDERRRVDHHLTSCVSCSQEAAELREAVWRLSDVTVTEPPPRLRDRVLAEVRRTRQEAPVAEAAEPAAPERPRRRWWRLPRLRLALGAAALAAAAAFAGVFITLAVQPTEGPDQSEQIAAVLEAPDAEVDFQQAEGGGRVTVVASAALDRAVVVVADLAPPGAGRSYQLWLVDEAGAVSAGVMDAGDDSATMVVEGLGDTQIVGVTNEPAGGSANPTQPMVAGVELSA